MHRRKFLQTGLAAAATIAARNSLRAEPSADAPVFSTQNAEWQRVYDHAVTLLAANVQTMPHFDGPVLIEGAEYAGIWLECAPQEGLVYRRWNPQAAINNHLTFFALQREDGQLPANNKRSQTGFGQIQMVVPIAATAWEIADATGNDELLHKAYDACSRWDAWLAKYRNLRGTGLCEGFCTYDTGHDNSPRWKGVINQCPGKDAKRFVPGQGTPRLCPDLSATVYGGRIALAEMARALGKTSDIDRWQQSAETIRRLILEKLYVPEDGAFYDLDTDNKFIRVRGDVISRVCGEHVITDQKIFDNVWTKQLGNPAAFWAPYPLPSIAMNDPTFVRPIPRNSWGGASQALTALRAPRWFDHYGKRVEFGHMMDAWCKALIADNTFRQQCDPETGVFTEGGSKSYSPAALVLLDYTWRLAGITERKGQIEFNVRPNSPAAQGSRFALRRDDGTQAEMRYIPGGADLFLEGKKILTVHGTARVQVLTYVTLPAGRAGIRLKPGERLIYLEGLTGRPETVKLTRANGVSRTVKLTNSEGPTLL
jgi:hypothetical protein